MYRILRGQGQALEELPERKVYQPLTGLDQSCAHHSEPDSPFAYKQWGYQEMFLSQSQELKDFLWQGSYRSSRTTAILDNGWWQRCNSTCCVNKQVFILAIQFPDVPPKRSSFIIQKSSVWKDLALIHHNSTGHCHNSGMRWFISSTQNQSSQNYGNCYCTKFSVEKEVYVLCTSNCTDYMLHNFILCVTTLWEDCVK